MFRPSLKARSEASFGDYYCLNQEIEDHTRGLQDKHDTLLALVKEFKDLFESKGSIHGNDYEIALFNFYAKLRNELERSP